MPDKLGREVEVPKVRTTPPESELCLALANASREVLGAGLSRAAMGVLVAQIYLETGRLRSCFNFNLGNVRDMPGDGVDYVLLWTWEMLPGPRGELQRWEGFGAFRAYPTLEDGVREHLEFLTNFERRPRYREVWDAVVAGDARATAYALKRRGYYTADADDYARAMESIAREFATKTRDVLLPVGDELPAWRPGEPQPATNARPVEATLYDHDPRLLSAFLDDLAVDELHATHVRGFHRPTHVIDAIPSLASSADLARVKREQLAQLRASIG